MLSHYRTEIIFVALGIAVLAASLSAEQIILHEPGRLAGTERIAAPTVHTELLAALLDDTYIHLVYARNLANGYGFAFTPGTPLSADTSPLWVMLLVPFALLGVDLLLAASFLSALFYLILLPGVYRVARDVFGLPERYAIAAGAFTLLFGRLIWSSLSGMEVTLATLLLLLIVEEHERSRQRGNLRLRQGIFLGLAILTRPEFVFVAALVAIDLIALRRKNWQRVAQILVIAFLIVLPVLIFNLITSGSLSSHSSKVQGAHLRLIPDLYYLFRFALGNFLSSNALLAVALGAALFWLTRERRYQLLLAILIGLPIAFAFVAPQYRHHGRYLFPLFPLFIIAGTRAVELLVQRWKISDRHIALFLSLCILFSGADAVRWIGMLAYDGRNINDQQVEAAKWVAKNFTSADTIAADDVGALRYYSSATLVDLTGLTTPSLYPVRDSVEPLWQAIHKHGAATIIIYDSLNRAFIHKYRDSLTEINAFRVRLPLRSSADSILKAYRFKTCYDSAR